MSTIDLFERLKRLNLPIMYDDIEDGWCIWDTLDSQMWFGKTPDEVISIVEKYKEEKRI